MNRRRKTEIAFLLIVLMQGVHSLEEYIGELWTVFPPAAFLSGIFSKNLEKGFLIINISLFLAGLAVWFLLRSGSRIASALVWFWIVIELINGIGHPVWAIAGGGYRPGLMSAVVLFFLALYMLKLKLDTNTNN